MDWDSPVPFSCGKPWGLQFFHQWSRWEGHRSDLDILSTWPCKNSLFGVSEKVPAFLRSSVDCDMKCLNVIMSLISSFCFYLMLLDGKINEFDIDSVINLWNLTTMVGGTNHLFSSFFYRIWSLPLWILVAGIRRASLIKYFLNFAVVAPGCISLKNLAKVLDGWQKIVNCSKSPIPRFDCISKNMGILSHT